MSAFWTRSDTFHFVALHCLYFTDLFSFVSFSCLPFMVPLHTVSLKFFSYFVVHPNLVKRRHTLAQGEVASQWNLMPDPCWYLCWLCSCSPPSSTALTKRTRKPQKHFPGLCQDQGCNQSKTWHLIWSCTAHCRTTTLHARPSTLFHKISQSLWRYALPFNTSSFTSVLASSTFGLIPELKLSYENWSLSLLYLGPKLFLLWLLRHSVNSDLGLKG